MSASRARLNAIARRLPDAAHAPTHDRPNIIEFVTSPRYLGQELFPRQATLLKIICLALELFTAYDYSVIAEWASGFRPVVDGGVGSYEGSEGIVADVLERIERCRSTGYKWFREVIMVVGRRGSKGFLGAVLAAWVIWNILEDESPQKRFGIATNKTLTIPIFAGNRDQASANQFKDLADVLRNAPCFAPYIDDRTSGQRIRLFTRAQLRRASRGPGLIEIRAVATTHLAGRGPAVPVALFDEMAHASGAGSTDDADDVYTSTTPAVAQFGVLGLIYLASSPWEKLGAFYQRYLEACAFDPGTGLARNPDIIAVQLTSWALYEDARRGEEIEMWRGGPRFISRPPIIELTEQLLREEAANPETFGVEYRSQWATSGTAYLRPGIVDGIFAPFGGGPLVQQATGRPGIGYVAHGDPSKSQANFGFAIGHREDRGGVPHVVFDVLHAWQPAQFADGIIDYMQIEREICDYLDRFNITSLTFDQYNSAGAIQRIRHYVRERYPARRVQVEERTATGPFNLQAYEILKTAAGHGIIHAPDSPLARTELEFLQFEHGKVVAPTKGPCITKDIADSMANVTYALIGEDAQDIFRSLAAVPLGASQPGTLLGGGGPLSIGEQFSRAGRASARRPQPYDPSRGIRRDGPRRWNP